MKFVFECVCCWQKFADQDEAELHLASSYHAVRERLYRIAQALKYLGAA